MICKNSASVENKDSQASGFVGDIHKVGPWYIAMAVYNTHTPPECTIMGLCLVQTVGNTLHI